MRTRTRTDSPVGQRLDLSWDTPSADTPPVENASADENQKPLGTPAAPSEPVSPIPTMETSPASLNGSESSRQELASSSEDTPSLASPAVPTVQDSPDAASAVETASLAAVSEEPAPATEEAPKPTLSATPPSPALPSSAAEQPLPPPSAKDAPATGAPDNSAETLLEDAGDKPQEVSPASPKLPRKPAPTVNIIPKEEPVGVVLARKREEANVKVEDLAKRLNINSFVIRYLESGDYEGLSRTFGENNCVYIIFNFKSIGEELGMSKNEIDDLVEKLNKEIVTAGLKLDAPVKHDDDAKDLNSSVRRRPVKSVLPKLIVITLVVVCLLIFFLAVVVPYVSRKRSETGAAKRVDFLPLIEQPWNNMRTIPPQQLPIP